MHTYWRDIFINHPNTNFITYKHTSKGGRISAATHMSSHVCLGSVADLLHDAWHGGERSYITKLGQVGGLGRMQVIRLDYICMLDQVSC